MKKNKFKLSVFILLIFRLSSIQAQETIPTTGGEASGSNGSASYTIGQMVYTTQVGTNGNSVAQGVQQPYEISIVTEIPEAKDINLSVSAYPNPTSNYLTVKVENYETANLQCQIFDINGKLLQKVNCTSNEISIDIQDYPAANYFVKILDNKKEIKVFKIIKTN